VGHTPDSAKVGVLRRVAIGAEQAGAERIVVAGDAGRVAERAVAGIDSAVLVEGPCTGSALDTRRGAAQLAELGCRPIVVIGGDGTCRDVAIGAPEAAIIAISTGTNNVFPTFVDGSSAGAAAGLVATGAIDADRVGQRAKVLHVEIATPEGTVEHELALVDVALTDDVHTGARAVLGGAGLRAVVCAIATPASTGLSAVAGRVRPLSRREPGAVVVWTGGERRVLVPLVPGTFDELAIGEIALLEDGGSVVLDGPGALAYDGERHTVLAHGATATVTVRADGPLVIDVARALHCAAASRLFDVAVRDTARGRRDPGPTTEAPDGD
jgi:hypothetical protein